MLHIIRKGILPVLLGLLLALVSASGIFVQGDAVKAEDWTWTWVAESNYTKVGLEINGATGTFQLDSQGQEIGYFERQVSFGTTSSVNYMIEFGIHAGENDSVFVAVLCPPFSGWDCPPLSTYDLFESIDILESETDDTFWWHVHATENDADTLHYELINQTTGQVYFDTFIDLQHSSSYPVEILKGTDATMEYWTGEMHGGGSHTISGLSYYHAGGEVDNFYPAEAFQSREIRNYHPTKFDVSLGPIFTTTLPTGWNTLSTPVKLDADNNTMGQILGDSITSIDAIYRWDTQNQCYVVPSSEYEVSPLEAFVVKVKPGTFATITFIPDWWSLEVPTRYLTANMNLVGIAPALEEGDFPAVPVDVALESVERTPEGWRGYSQVISPAYNQPYWYYIPGGQVHDMLSYHGYWVVMTNPDTLIGSSTFLPFVTNIHYKD